MKYKKVNSGPACRQAGQALVTFLLFVVISLTITSAASIVSVINSQSSEKLEQGTVAQQAAESGAENAMIRLLRDPSYTGETLTIGLSTVVITVTGTTTKTVTASATNGTFIRQTQIIASYTNNVLTITSWKELF